MKRSISDCPYRLLEVCVSSTDEEVKRAFKKKASDNHPDKGGSSEDFDRVKKAFDLIKTATNRKAFSDSLQMLGFKSCSTCSGNGRVVRRSSFKVSASRRNLCKLCGGSGYVK